MTVFHQEAEGERERENSQSQRIIYRKYLLILKFTFNINSFPFFHGGLYSKKPDHKEVSYKIIHEIIS